MSQNVHDRIVTAVENCCKRCNEPRTRVTQEIADATGLELGLDITQLRTVLVSMPRDSKKGLAARIDEIRTLQTA